MSRPTILSANQLSIGYSRRTVAVEISLALHAGEAVAVLGPNGCGKTTLFRTLLGLMPSLAGEVWLGEKNITLLTPAQIARSVAYVPQITGGFFNFSVIEIVEMARTPHLAWYAKPGPRDHQIAQAALDELGIASFANREFNQLSGGEQQLVLIARALAAEAPIVLLDEPTASLDFGNQFLILDEIKKLTARGRAVLFTTHNPDHALRIAQQTLTISRDGCVAVGATNDILNSQSLAALYGVNVELIACPQGLMAAVGQPT